jgi:hypothetical protein
MIVRGNEGKITLHIFNNFVTDHKLPKYKKEAEDSIINERTGGLTLGNSADITTFLRSDIGATTGELTFMESLSYSHNVFSMIAYRILKKCGMFKSPKDTKLDAKSIAEFFNGLKHLKKTLILDNNEILDAYELALEGATELGQTALVETLLANKKIILNEVLLLDNGLSKYVTEEDVIKFYEGTSRSKNLVLVWIKNFVRIIPKEIQEAKKRADELKVFDNYVVLTYDPKGQMVKLTEKEKEAAKDPILFGVIKGSTKLYFIGEWEDEYCDLKLEDIMSFANKDITELNKDSVKMYI